MGAQSQTAFIAKIRQLLDPKEHIFTLLANALKSDLGAVFTVDTWREIMRTPNDYLAQAAVFWFLTHGCALPVSTWVELIGVQETYYNHPMTINSLHELRAYGLTESDHWMSRNPRLTLPVVQLLQSRGVRQFHWRIHQQWWREINSSAAEILDAAMIASLADEADHPWPIEILMTYRGLPGWELRCAIPCNVFDVSIEYILQTADTIPWDLWTLSRRYDYTAEDMDRFLQISGTHRNALSTYPYLRNVKADLPTLLQGGSNEAVLQNRHHRLIDSYIFLRDKISAQDMTTAISGVARVIDLAEYRELVAVAPHHESQFRRMIRCGRQRWFHGMRGLTEVMFDEQIYRHTADVFALIVFMCDELVTLDELLSLQ